MGYPISLVPYSPNKSTGVAAVVVLLPVRPDGQEVPEHGLRRLQRVALDGPEEGGDGLRAHLGFRV